MMKSLYWRSVVKHSKPSGSYMYHMVQDTKTLHSAYRVYLCVPYRS
jgi:hypothetical protein